MSQMTPREIVEELDKHIVGQKAAKRAVAIALRNRWRRQQVAENLRPEITPKNILMIEMCIRDSHYMAHASPTVVIFNKVELACAKRNLSLIHI